jgi:hypothetical protein
MLEMIVILVLVVVLCVVSVSFIMAIIWMRKHEQDRDQVIQTAEALAQLDEALDSALVELNRVGNLVQKEIGEKYQAMLFLYNLLEDKQKEKPEGTAGVEVVLPERIRDDLNKIDMAAINKVEIDAAIAGVDAAVTGTADTDTAPSPVPVVEPEAVPVEPPAPEIPPAKPKPRRKAINPKHEKILELSTQGKSITDIAKELGIGQGEIKLIIEMAGKG